MRTMIIIGGMIGWFLAGLFDELVKYVRYRQVNHLNDYLSCKQYSRDDNSFMSHLEGEWLK